MRYIPNLYPERMYIYSTPTFEHQVVKHQLESKVNRLCQELEEMESSEVQARFERLYPYLKRKEGNFRLIARIVICGNENVLCWLKVFNRGDRDYQVFLRDREHYADHSLERNLQSNLKLWLNEQKTNQPVHQTSSKLPEDLRIWLERPSWKIDVNRSIIYESEIWVSKFQQDEIHSQATVFHQLVEDLINGFEANLGLKTKWSQIRLYDNGQCYILYSPLTTVDHPPRQVLFLIAPFNCLPLASDIDQIVAELTVRGNGSNWWKNRHCLTVENLISVAKRAYPSYLLADSDFWLAIEDGDGVNLALSSEEKAILHSVSTQQSLPLFLNGRAGSGKSTMLFYLFTDYCDRYWQYYQETQPDLQGKPHPLFLTYNQALSDFARNKVQSLLRYNYRFLAKNELQSIPDISKFFQSFRPFLISLLPKEIQLQFLEENYISFHRFRQLCLNRRRKYSPEKCWQVIRTFIKGYYLDERNSYGTVLDYQEVPQKEKTVSEAEFQQIYDRVWQWYREYTRKNNLWDDQDLIRTVLSNKYYQSKYTTIFCDEAQDFTRLELQLILRLSVFSQYNLQPENITSLPFAFAGDPLQTLNPTGFRWDSLKSAFYSEVLTVLLPNLQNSLSMNFQELQYNYRSVKSIVGVNNLIQLWRKILFSLTTIKPQQARKFSSYNPQKFIIEHIDNRVLVNVLQDTLIIIPCDEGGEKDFIVQDEILSKLITEESTETPWNILSAIAAKGLEFTQVILYKFGEYCPSNIWQFKAEATAAEKYFLNKLYVAASRATEKLFIVDSQSGETKLWSKSSRSQFIEDFLAKINSESEAQEWRDNIQLIELGIYPEQMDSNHTEEIAATFETKGINSQNPELLRRARSAYKQLKNMEKAAYCLAWQLKLEQQYAAAGNQFLAISHLQQAYSCFWQAMAWQRLLELHSRQELKPKLNIPIPNLVGDLVNCDCLIPLIEFMANAKGKPESQHLEHLMQFTHFLQTEVNSSQGEVYPCSKQWQAALKIYQQQIEAIVTDRDRLVASDWENIANVLSSFSNNSPETVNLVAECFYAALNYPQAIHYWDRFVELTSKKYRSNKYYLALAAITELPTKLSYLKQAQAYRTIIELWVEHGKNRDRTWLEFVALAFTKLDSFNSALIVYCYLDDLPQVKSCWQRISQQASLKQIAHLLQYFLAKRYWGEAIAIIENLTPQIKQTPLKYYFIDRLANSQLTPDAIDKTLRQQYEQLIVEAILNNSNWQQYLSVSQIGVTLEKIGSLVLTLSFYENYTNSTNSQLCQFSRQRWLATKRKQVDYFNSSSQIIKAQQKHQELVSQARQWQIAIDSIDSQPPKPVKRKSAGSKINYSQSQLPIKISGLPTQTNLHTIERGVWQFQLHHWLIKTIASTKQVVITDVISDRQIQLNILSRQIFFDTFAVSSQPNQALFLTETQGKYQIAMGNHSSHAVELSFSNLKEKIIIEFTV